MSQKQQPKGKDVKAQLICGSCTGLEKERIQESRCIELGRLPSSRSCSSYKPDAFALVQEREALVENLIDMGSVMRRLSGNDLHIFAGLMLGERKTRRAGFAFMQKVYVRIGGRGRNYLHNFCIAYVLDANDEDVRLVSENAKTVISMPRSSDSIYNIASFAAIREECFAERKIVDPEVVRDDIRRTSTLQTLDEVDAAGLLDSPTAARRKIKKKPKDDLVSFVQRLNKGVITGNKNRELAGDEEFSW